MKKYYILFIIVVIAIMGSLVYVNNLVRSDFSEPLKKQIYHRIISLSPNITEILFELGLEEKIVGVTNFCNYPDAAKQKSKIGGYLDPNYEAIVLLKPDIVIILPEQENVKKYLFELGIKSFTVNNKTIADILIAIESIGRLCDVQQRTNELLENIQSRMQSISNKTRQLKKPSVLISIDRTIGSGVLSDVYAAGQKTHYDELITLAGGTNVLGKSKITYPVLTAEGIIYLNPEIIFDVVVDFKKQGLSENKIKSDWDCVGGVTAVKNKRIYVLGESYTVIPGPRFILLLEEMARIIHPEVW